MAVVLAVGELEKVYPVDMVRVGVAVGVLEAVGGVPRIATLSTVSAADADAATATAVRRQHKVLAAKPSAAMGNKGVACDKKLVPRGVSAMAAPTLVNAPAEPVVEYDHCTLLAPEAADFMSATHEIPTYPTVLVHTSSFCVVVCQQ